MDKRTRAREILRKLKKTYVPNKDSFLHYSNPLELLVATVLSAQCTDKRVNMITPKLFKKYKEAADYASAKLVVLEKEIKSSGFYKNKAKNLKGIGQMLVKKFDSKVPARLDDLMLLPGVARKTANLVMARGFGQYTGVAVDTHVMRLAPRFGLTKEKTQHGIERDLNKLLPPRSYLDMNAYCILHGRATCRAKKPDCPNCVLLNICNSYGKYMREYYNDNGMLKNKTRKEVNKVPKKKKAKKKVAKRK